jgi:DNA-binding beta-propeller fold protein YncE
MNCRLSVLAAAITLSCGTAAARQPEFSIQLNPLASYAGSGQGTPGTGIEIVAYDRGSRRVFAINAGKNTLDVVDLADPTSPSRVATIDFSPYGGGVNGVAVHDGLVAVASEATTRTDPGRIVFLDATSLALLGQVPAGALPDMVTFTPDGGYVLVANEGEPSEDYSVDPQGSVTVIDLRNGVAGAIARTAGFSAWIGQEADLRAAGMRIYGVRRDGSPSNAAEDIEPEYIAVQGPRAYVTLQENNAVAVLDIGQARIEAVLPLGYKNHDVNGQGLDPSDRDNGNLVNPWPVFGMFNPDAIAALKVRDEVFLLTANEGDARVYPTGNVVIDGVSLPEGSIFNEEVRVGSGAYMLDPSSFPNAAALKNNANLGRLTVTNRLGNADGEADFERIYAFGARSFSVWSPAALQASASPTAPNAGLVWDSGDAFEQVTRSVYPAQFNASNSNASRDDRSDNKGPEPEGIAVGRVGPRDYAFIALERIGGVLVYDVSDPRAPQFLQYVNTRAFGLDALPGQDDAGAEGVAFIAAGDSPNGRPLLLVGNEVSQTMSVFEVEALQSRR